MFRSARLKLTAWYLIIIMLISISFSIGMYKVLTHEVERFARIQRFRIEGGFREGHRLSESNIQPKFRSPGNFDPQLVNEVKERVVLILVIVNIGILAVSGLLGYFLAGRTLKPIKSMVDEQNRFITDASHELRTPLAALKSSMEVFLRDNTTTIKEARNLVKGSIEDVDNLTSLSDSLLQLSSYQKSNENMKFEKVDLSEIAKEAVNKVESLAKNKKITLQSDISLCEILGNKFSLKDLLVILLDNAIKYSKEGGSVALSMKKIDGFIQLVVTDKGIGLEEKDIKLIFDRFYRVDESRSDAGVRGYGLGLSIAKRIVEIHSGSISVESKINEGSTFIVTLPVKQFGSFPKKFPFS